jgi:acyl carrier protein
MSEDKNSELNELCQQLKVDLIEWLSLDDVTPDELGDDDALFGEGLGLDSLDAVEIVVMLQRQFGISPKDMDNKKEVFSSVKTLAQYVIENRK